MRSRGSTTRSSGLLGPMAEHQKLIFAQGKLRVRVPLERSIFIMIAGNHLPAKKQNQQPQMDHLTTWFRGSQAFPNARALREPQQ